jgi:hypothetical protein
MRVKWNTHNNVPLHQQTLQSDGDAANPPAATLHARKAGFSVTFCVLGDQCANLFLVFNKQPIRVSVIVTILGDYHTSCLPTIRTRLNVFMELMLLNFFGESVALVSLNITLSCCVTL